jgi:hypothetical protein
MSTVTEGQGVAVVDAPRRERLPRNISGGIHSALRKHPWLEWLIAAALCAVLLGQLLLSYRQLSQTIDEATHLYAGYRYLKCGDLDFSREHPPLARIVAAAPLLGMNLKVNCSPVQGIPSFSWRTAAATADSFERAVAGESWLYSQNWREALFHARMAVSSFAVAICLLVWFAARRMFDLITAIVATLLLTFEPNVLAYGSLVMTDVPVTCMLLFAVFGFYLWIRNRTAPFLLLTGLATGLTLLAKHSGMLPLLLIVVAAGCVELARRVRWVAYAVLCLIVLHAASSLHAYPNYLSYANEFWGGPTKAYKYLPAIDWGQAYPQAKDYLARHPADPCWLLTDFYWDPGVYGIHCQPIGYFFATRIPPRLRGTVIVSSWLLTTTRPEQGQAVAPFLKATPKDFIGGSALLVYEGDFDTRAAAGMSDWRWALLGEPLDAAMQDANDAVALVPKSPSAHAVRCQLLAKSGQPYAAIAECETAIELAEGDPLSRAEWQQLHEFEAIEEIIRSIRVANNLPNP